MLRRMFRRRLPQQLDQWLARLRRLDLAFTHDFLGTEFFPVEVLIGAVRRNAKWNPSETTPKTPHPLHANS